MRRPTSRVDAYRWHANALRKWHAPDDIVYSDVPQAGWYKRPLAKGGPMVPARIWIDAEVDMDTGELLEEERFLCEVNGERADAIEQWQWLCQNPISEEEFRHLTALVEWTLRNMPDEPMANPRQAVDWSKVPTPTFNRRENHD